MKIFDLECTGFSLSGGKDYEGKVFTHVEVGFTEGAQEVAVRFSGEPVAYEVGKQYRITIEELDGAL